MSILTSPTFLLPSNLRTNANLRTSPRPWSRQSLSFLSSLTDTMRLSYRSRHCTTREKLPLPMSATTRYLWAMTTPTEIGSSGLSSSPLTCGWYSIGSETCASSAPCAALSSAPSRKTTLVGLMPCACPGCCCARRAAWEVTENRWGGTQRDQDRHLGPAPRVGSSVAQSSLALGAQWAAVQ